MIPTSFGRYQVRRLIGEGGFGKVWLAWDPLLDREVAVKVPHGDWMATSELLAEARALAKLEHPGIVRVLDAGMEGSKPFLVLELVDGLSLEGVLLRSRAPADPAAVLELLRMPAAGLDAAHEKGILHGDIKPANILVPLEGPLLGGLASVRGGLKIADLGLLALTARGGKAVALGDPRYAAPEAWLGRPSRSSDIHSLAAVVFRLVAGSAPLEGSAKDLIAAAPVRERRRLREVRPDASATLDDALARALSLDPSERPASAGTLLDELATALAESDGRRRFVRDARARIAAREETLPRTSCGACNRPLHPRATACAHCGESV